PDRHDRGAAGLRRPQPDLPAPVRHGAGPAHPRLPGRLLRAADGLGPSAEPAGPAAQAARAGTGGDEAMSGNLPLVLAVLGGATAAFGVFLLVTMLVPAPPALGPALARLHPGAHPTNDHPLRDAIRARFRVPRTNLAILGRSIDRYFLTLGLSALLALLAPALVTLTVLVTHLPVSPAIPAGGALLAAAGAAWLAHR